MSSRFIFILILLCFVSQQGVAAPKESFFNIQSESSAELVISMTLPPPVLKPVETAEQVYLDVELIGESRIGREGFPDLPAVTRLVRVPENCEVIPDVLEDCFEEISLSQPISPFFPNDSDLLNNAHVNLEKPEGLFPKNRVVIGDSQYFRGEKLVPVTLYPFQYDSQNNQLLHHNHFTVAMRFEPKNEENIGSESQRSISCETRDAYRFLQALTLNPPTRDDADDPLPNGGYLIVVGTGINREPAEPHVNRLADWKRACGHHVEIVWGENNPITIYDELVIPAYREWDPPLEYLCLIGPFNNPHVLNRHDLNYGLIDGGGDDHIPEIAVCRLGATDSDRVEVVINRVLGYEKDPFTQDINWFNRAGVVSERVGSFRNSITHTLKWIAAAERRAGFSDITEHYYLQDHGRSSQEISNFISRPGNIIFVRGPSIPTRFPTNSVFPLYIPIGGGHTHGSLDRMWNVGTPDQLSGPSFVTSTQHSPNTLSCNILIGTMARALLIEELPVGWAAGYGMANLDYDGGLGFENFIREFQMYGEPGQKVWLGRPRNFRVSHPDIWSHDQDMIEVSVEDGTVDEPIGNAMVTLTQPGELLTCRYTNNDGVCSIPINGELEGDITLTVTKDGFIPYYQDMDERNHPVFAQAFISNIREVNGNRDNAPNPGETLDLFISVENIGTNQAVNNPIALITCESPWLTFEDEMIEFGRIDPQSSIQSETPLQVSVSHSASGGILPGFSLSLISDEGEWNSPLILDIEGPSLEFHEIVGGNIVGADPQELQIVLRNNGSVRSIPVLTELVSLSTDLLVESAEAGYPAISVGRSAPANNEFLVYGSSITVPGTISPMMLLLRVREENVPDTVFFELQVGVPEEGGPMPPDEYGYVCYDNTDNDWILAPEYEWIEIDPDDDDSDYDGTSPFDNIEGDIAIEIDLPFEFQFYGERFNEVTICTNGFIAFGENTERCCQYDNFPLDQLINGSFGMIAPYWDNLDVSDHNQDILTYYNADEHYFVVEWVNASIVGAGEGLTFEVILYDPDFYSIESGDGNILCQYKRVPNDIEGDFPRFFSTGICSPDGKIGINYACENQYPVTSAPIQSRRAVLFTTFRSTPTGSLSGTAYDAATGAPLDSVLIRTSLGQKVMSSQNGEWAIPEAWASSYNLIASKSWYNDLIITNLHLAENNEEQFDLQLLHPEFSISSNNIETQLAAGREHEVELTISNEGNGELEWECSKGYVGGHNGIGQMIQSLVVAPVVGDIQLEGVTCINGEYYVSGRGTSNPCMIYVLDSVGRLQRRMEQVGRSRTGMLDLTYDGTLIWGSGEQDIFGFDLIGNRISSFRGPFNNNRALAYDPDLNALWIGNDANVIYAVNTQGEELRRQMSFGWEITGMAYWNEDPDECNLYILHKVGIEDKVVHKMNTLTGDTILVGNLETEQIGQPGGIFITENMGPFGLVFGMLVNDYLNRVGDRIDIWQMGSDIGWLDVNPMTGILDADSDVDMILQVNATGLISFDYNCQLTFNHTAFDGEDIVDISVHVLDPADNPEYSAPVPRQLELFEPFPNPFNSAVKLSLYLPKQDQVSLSVFDLNGREVSRLVDGIVGVGNQMFVWDAIDFPAGVYIVRMDAGDVSEMRKVVLVR